MHSVQYMIRDRIPTVDVNNSRKSAIPQGDLLTDHLFTELKEMSRKFPGYHKPMIEDNITEHQCYFCTELKLVFTYLLTYLFYKLANFKGVGLNLPENVVRLLHVLMLLQLDPERMTHLSLTWL